MNTEQLKTDDAFEDKYINPIVDSILLFHSRQPIKRLSDFVSQEIQRDLESRWISVKERLPEKNEWVLVYIKCKNLRDEVTYETHTGKLQGTFWVIGGHFSFDIGEPLFWQPLPEPPKTIDPMKETAMVSAESRGAKKGREEMESEIKALREDNLRLQNRVSSLENICEMDRKTEYQYNQLYKEKEALREEIERLKENIEARDKTIDQLTGPRIVF